MPSKTRKMAGFMKLCAYSPEKARKKCPPRDVAREFANADDARKRIKKMTR